MQLNIRPFDFSTMANDATVLLIGKRGTGKSTMLRNIMYHMRHKLDVGIAMCPTEDAATEETGLRSFMPRTLIYDQLSTTAIRNFLDYQKGYISKNGKDRTRNGFIILDDCCSEKNALNNTEMREIHVNGRHRKIFLINAVQYIMEVGTLLRANIDYVFVLKDNNKPNKEKLHQIFFGMFGSKETFCTAMDSLTRGHSAMVVDNKSSSQKIEDCVFYFQGKPKLPPFTLCSQVYWDMSAAVYRDPSTVENVSKGLVVTRVSKSRKKKDVVADA